MNGGAVTIVSVDAHYSIAVGASPTPISLPDDADAILAQAFTAGVNYTTDGSAPATARGFQIPVGTPGPILVLLPRDRRLIVVQAAANARLEYQPVRFS